MTTPIPATRRRPEGRYDDEHRFPQWAVWALATVLAALLVGGSYAAWQRSAAHRTPATLVGWSVVDDRTVELRVRVDKKDGATVTCALRALGEDGQVVAAEDVTVGPGSGDVQHRMTTTARAARAEVVGCSA